MYVRTPANVEVRIFSQDETDRYKRVFDAYDDDHDGLVSVECLGRIIHTVGFNPLPDEVTDMIEDINSPTFDFHSLLYLLSRHAREAEPEAELVDSLTLFDKDGSGRLNEQLVRQILRSIPHPLTDSQIDRLLSGLEIDERSRTIDIGQLARKMTGQPPIKADS
jgi:Ca2+-binding EF-hand superfamily protein